MATTHAHRYKPTPTDGFPTPTSRTQAETEAVLKEHLPSRSRSRPTSGSGSPTTSSTPTPAKDGQTKGAVGGVEEAILHKTAHMQFLIKHLVNGFPARYVSQDASQPWLLFWTLQAFSVLQVGIDRANGQRIIDKVLSWQHPDGGFGGGPGQAAHLLPTYAAVCCLGVVGRGGENGGWDQIDREKMYAWFMSLKQPDGSFLVAKGGEVDVRGIYCLLAVATLLDLLTPELVAGTPGFLSSCQTYEGGFASGSCFSGTLGNIFSPAKEGEKPWEKAVRGEAVSSVPIGMGGGAGVGGFSGGFGGFGGLGGGGYEAKGWGAPGAPGTTTARARPALGEAHGGYTFCALASWVLLQPFVGGERGVLNASVPVPAPSSTAQPSSAESISEPQSQPAHPETAPFPKQAPSPKQAPTPEVARIAVPALLRWLTSMQGSPAEIGGFRGRTNKLVDGCYSWWCGGAFALLEALGVGGMQNAREGEEVVVLSGDSKSAGEDGGDKGEGKGEGEGGEIWEEEGGDVWDEVDDGLYNRRALQEYILYAGQHPAGGLRDKPPKNADAYHTLYCLSGLSAAQHHVFPSRARRAQVEEAWRPNGRDTTDEDARRKRVFSALLSWTEEEGTSIIVGGPANRVNATHPLTNLTITHTEAMAAHFYNQRVPTRARPAVQKV